MTTLAILTALISFVSITSSKQVTKTATATPDQQDDDLSITLSGDYVTVEDGRWKIWTPESDQNEDVTYSQQSDAFKASQTGMNMAIQVSKTFSFDKNQQSSITIKIDGELDPQSKDINDELEGDMILAFGNVSATQYFASMIRLDNQCPWSDYYRSHICQGTWMYPKCESVFADGNVADIADGSAERIWTVACPKINGVQQCDELDAIDNGFPVTVVITNKPRAGRSTYKYINYNNHESNTCSYKTAFEVRNGLNFYIAGEGINAAEIFYISEISVSKTYCDNRPEWRSTYGRNTGLFSLEDPCYSGTNFKFQMETLTEYTSSSDTTGTVTDISGGSWTNSGQYSTDSQYGDDGISARINKYTQGAFENEMVIFQAEGTVNGASVGIGTLKYSINIDNGFSDTAADDATLKVCVGITANDDEEEQTDEWEDASVFTLANGAFKLQNEKTATCTSTDGGDTNIDVIAQRDGSVLCYTFNKCDGKIVYDPFVYYEGEEEESVAIRYGGFGFIGCVIMAIYALF